MGKAGEVMWVMWVMWSFAIYYIISIKKSWIKNPIGQDEAQLHFVPHGVRHLRHFRQDMVNLAPMAVFMGNYVSLCLIDENSCEQKLTN